MNYRPRKTALAAAIATAIASAQTGIVAQAQEQVTELEEIVVTGSRIKRTDLTAASPVSVVTGEQIAQTGTVHIDSLLNEMPQVMPGWTNSSNFPGTGTATVDLRGLGAKRTLVLVNGKRFIPTSGDGTVDISGIPTALVDRVEVMTGGASAVYGSDAMAGVVNFILDDRYEGFKVGGSYDLTTDYQDSAIYNINMKMGTNFADDGGNITIFAQYTDRAGSIQGDRPYTTYALDDKMRNGVATLVHGGSSSPEDTRLRLEKSAIPATIGDNLNGNPNSIKFDNGAPLAWNDPQDRYNYAPPSYLQVPQERFQTQLFATRDISKKLNFSFEAMYMNQVSATQFAPQPRWVNKGDGLHLRFADNPYLTQASKDIIAASELISDAKLGLPTGDGIVHVTGMGHRVSSNGPRRDIRRFDVYRALWGVDGELNDTWEYELYYTKGSSSNAHRVADRVDRAKWTQAVNAITSPTTGLPVCVDPSGGCQPVNLWGKDLISDEAIAFVKTAQNFWDVYTQETAGLTFVGDFESGLSAGNIGAAMGVEWRAEHYRSEPDSNAMVGDAIRLPTDGGYDVGEAFGEINIPLIAGSSFADYLGVSAAIRLANYSTIGKSNAWKYGVEFTPAGVEGLRFRAGKQKSIRAPNVIELYAPQMGAGLTIYQDPCDAGTGLMKNAEQQTFCNAWGAPTGFTQLNGTISALRNSNPNLKPEIADTWTLGAVLQPESLADNEVSFAVDYYNIEITDAIAPFGGGVDNNITSCFFSLDLASTSCSNAVRDDFGDFYPVDSTLTNVTIKKVTGVDIQAEFSFEADAIGGGTGNIPGRVDVFVLATYQMDNGFQATELLPFIECAGKFGVPCGGEIDGTGSPRLRANTRVAWSNGPYRLAFNWRWLEGMEDARIVRVAAFGLDTSDIVNSIPAEAITTPAYNYIDVNGAWVVSERTTVRFGLDNLLGKEPPMMGDAQIQSNTEPGTYDVIGRRFWLNFDWEF